MIAIPAKRHDKTIVAYLDRSEIEALLAAPDRTTWLGRRDHALLLLAIQTGAARLRTRRPDHRRHQPRPPARTSVPSAKAKARSTARLSTAETVAVLQRWLRERHGDSRRTRCSRPAAARPLTRDAIEHRLTKHTATAARTCPSLSCKRITPHTLRHYVDGWVMWPAGVFPLLAGVVRAGSGHITRGVIGRRGRAIRGDLGLPSSLQGTTRG